MIWILTFTMLVVSNTSPLSNLAIIDRLELLREQLGQINIPVAVQVEISRHPLPAAHARLQAAIRDGWIRIVPLTVALSGDLASTLDIGEAEALALAVELKASLVLLDESAARLKARQLGLAHTGVLGVLRRGKQDGRIPSLAVEIDRLRAEARFFINPTLEKRLLSSVGESRGD